MKKSLFIFRRDLRIHDNTALNEALKNSNKVIPIFIFDKRQLIKNSYRSDNCVQFMLESLDDLEEQLKLQKAKLYYFNGVAEDVVNDLIKKESINAVFLNKDYTPFSIKRDKKIETVCKDKGVEFFSYDDLLLTVPGTVFSGKGTPYTVYTPFMKKCRTLPVSKPSKLAGNNFYTSKIKTSDLDYKDKILKNTNKDLYVRGGRFEAIKILKALKNKINYKEERDFPAIKGTTGLSAHNKFGTVSVREVYKQVKAKLGVDHILINELYWRDFFTHIAFHFPHVFRKAFNPKYEKIDWENNKTKFKVWCEGKTGFPIVDAGMRELNSTGFMHNRVRMIVASFLVKDLHINWQWGEKYFAQKLLDYDPAVNNGNWQWAASTGCDAQPYFRIFNPWTQQKKFDLECIYVKKWVPELEDVDSKILHKIAEKSVKIDGYPQPIVDHSEARIMAIDLFEGD